MEGSAMRMVRTDTARSACFPLLLVLAASFETASAQQCSIERLSVSPTGIGGNGFSSRSTISGNGQLVAFGSNADNLVPGDVNSDADIFLRDRTAGTTTLVSRPTAGGQANGGSGIPAISSDGRFVAFRSVATNLDPADGDPKPDIYRHDRVTGETVLVSHRLVPGTHPDGAFMSSISQDGRFVAFDCWDDNLVPGDLNGTIDIYVRDMQTGVMELISVGNQGELGDSFSDAPSISWDGRYVGFASSASNWFPGNAQKRPHVYVRDRVLGTTTLVSYSPSGTYGPVGRGFGPSISGDGSRMAFMYWGADIQPSIFNGHTWTGAQVFVRDLLDGSLTYVGYSVKGGVSAHECRYPTLSSDGRFVAWDSLSDDLTVTQGHGNENIFHRDLETGVTVLVSRGMGGTKPDGYSVHSSISADGRTIAFASQAGNLVPGDSGLIVDIFVRECDVASPAVYCVAKQGASGCKPVMSFLSLPSATAGSGFLLWADGLVGAQLALVLYSTRPAYARALGSGVLCLQAPVHRTPALATGGTPIACDGSIAFDMNAWIASGIDPTLQAGSPAYAQVWCRDPADPFGGVLSDAVAFLIEP
jgi:Tol biopolymer transport system component